MLALDLNKYHYKPKEELKGWVSWHFEQEPKKLEIRLFWYTRGKGTEDALIIDVKKIDSLVPQGSYDFNFWLPKAPYSFSGKLISLIWAVEFFVKPSGESALKQFVLAPEGVEINIIEKIEKDES